MFLRNLTIENYKLFENKFNIDNFNVPDKVTIGTGLNLIVGENGCGKTTILDAIAISMLDYKGEAFNIYDFNDLNKAVNICFYSNEEFSDPKRLWGGRTGSGERRWSASAKVIRFV